MLAVEEGIFQHSGTSRRVWWQSRHIWEAQQGHSCALCETRQAGEVGIASSYIISLNIFLWLMLLIGQSQLQAENLFQRLFKNRVISRQRCLLACLFVSLMDATSWWQGNVFRKSKKNSIKEHTSSLYKDILHLYPLCIECLLITCIPGRKALLVRCYKQTELSPRNILTKGNFQCLLTRWCTNNIALPFFL